MVANVFPPTLSLTQSFSHPGVPARDEEALEDDDEDGGGVDEDITERGKQEGVDQDTD